MKTVSVAIFAFALSMVPLSSASAPDKPLSVAVAAIENRFIASGTILDARRTSAGIHAFKMKIEKVATAGSFPNMGAPYEGKEQEFFSEIGAPAGLQPGKRATVILRLSGDERHQALFLVEVIHGSGQ